MAHYTKCLRNNYFIFTLIFPRFKFTKSGLKGDELKITEYFIKQDVRNNSAWNQRFFIVKQNGFTDFKMIQKEFLFTLEFIKLVLDNESSWNYLRGLLKTFGDRTLRQFPAVGFQI